MRGDTIIVEEHHRRAAAAIAPVLLADLRAGDGKFTLTVAGESGSGKSETATAIADALAADGIASVIFQQDDYFVHPPKSNDRARRKDIAWVGPGEVRIDLLDSHLKAFRERGAWGRLAAPSDDINAHRTDQQVDKSLDEQALANLREWYADDFRFVALCEQWIAGRGWRSKAA